MKQAPSWLRKGNAVQILHRSGIRGSIYIVGQGTTSPTPLSGDAFPDPGGLPDVMLSGGKIYATDPNSLGVIITAGTYRINDVVYNLTSEVNSLLYGQVPEIFYGQAVEIFYGDDMIFYLDVAPSVGYYRYDAFCVGEDGVIDYLKGTESVDPVKPTIPSDHILIDTYILVIGGVSAITDAHIGMLWTEPVASSITLDIEGEGISYSLPYDNAGTPGDTGDDPQYAEADIVISVLDQYGNTKTGAFPTVLTKNVGDGDLWSEDSSYDTEVTQTISNTYTFKYRREQLLDNAMVVFSVSVKSGTNIFELVGIIELGEDT